MGFCGKVDDCIHIRPASEIANISAHTTETGVLPKVFKGPWVGCVSEGVDSVDIVSPFKKFPCEVLTDKSCTSCNCNVPSQPATPSDSSPRTSPRTP